MRPQRNAFCSTMDGGGLLLWTGRRERETHTPSPVNVTARSLKTTMFTSPSTLHKEFHSLSLALAGAAPLLPWVRYPPPATEGRGAANHQLHYLPLQQPREYTKKWHQHTLPSTNVGLQVHVLRWLCTPLSYQCCSGL